jgi:hypothetical protein
MATTPRGDDQMLRRAVIVDLARRIAEQRAGAGNPNARPAPLRRKPSLTAIVTPEARLARKVGR